MRRPWKRWGDALAGRERRARRNGGSGLRRSIAVTLGVGLLGPAAGAEPAYSWRLPEGLSPPPVPPDNPMSFAKVELGRRLFADRRLSFNETTSCATCHDPAREFTDGRRRAIGASGVPHPRNTPSLWNVGYQVSLTWIDQGLRSLESQLRLPLTGRDPVEMGFGPREIARLAGDPVVARLHREAFGPEPLGEETVVRALACYVRTLIRMEGAFDRLVYWDDETELGPRARAGMRLFLSDRLGCSLCHSGPLLSGATVLSGRAQRPVFHRTGVSGSAQPFRAPSLRRVAKTAPYMHDGSLATLSDVIDFYARGGGAGAERLLPFRLEADEREALLAFLSAL